MLTSRVLVHTCFPLGRSYAGWWMTDVKHAFFVLKTEA